MRSFSLFRAKVRRKGPAMQALGEFQESGLKRYRYAAPGGAHAGLRDHERAPPVVESDRRGGARFDRLDECVELAPVGLGVTVDEKVEQRIAAQAVLAVALQCRGSVVARD